MAMFDWSLREVIEKPFAHVTDSAFIEPEAYERLRQTFPDCPPSSGPSGHSLFWEDEGYQRLLAEHPEWQALSDAFHSQAFIDWAIAQFGPVWARERCVIDLAKAVYVPYHEDRIDKERRYLRKIEYAPHELWVRMDIHQGKVGYTKSIHRDHARRLLTMLVYVCDHTENELSGGELLLQSRPFVRWFSPPIMIRPRENLMVSFPCSGRSYHSVPRITSLGAPRNYLQIQISSSVDAWNHGRF